MNINDLAEFLSIIDKIGIEQNNNLTRAEKEFFKNCVNEAKKHVNENQDNDRQNKRVRF